MSDVHEPAEGDEAVEPEGDEAVEPEGDEAVEPGGEPEADDRPSSNAILAAMERENTRHAKAIAKALDLPVDALNHCPVCEGVGFTPEPIEPAPEIVKATDAMTCPTCKGHGRLEYPTLVAGHRFQVCVDCAGAGWKRQAPQPTDAPTYAPTLPSNGAPGVPAGHVLVKVDPNAPDAPAWPPPPTTSAPVHNA